MTISGLAIAIAVFGLIVWYGLEIKLGDIFSYELYPLRRFFIKR